jgi:hypothetical protein
MVGVYRSTKRWISDTFEPLKPVYDAWMKVIAGFSWILVRVGLTFAFVTVFLIYGIVLRLTGRDPMNRKLDSDMSSYWTDNTITNDDLSDFKEQY